MPMTVAALEVGELRCRLGGLDAVAGVSFSVPEGSTVGLIGPNGAGKSTLVGLIAGTRLPDAGTVTLFGNDISRLPAWKRSRLGLARTFQLSGEFARLTVLENLMVACRDKTGETLWGALFRRRAQTQPVRGQAHLPRTTVLDAMSDGDARAHGGLRNSARRCGLNFVSRLQNGSFFEHGHDLRVT